MVDPADIGEIDAKAISDCRHHDVIPFIREVIMCGIPLPLISLRVIDSDRYVGKLQEFLQLRAHFFRILAAFHVDDGSIAFSAHFVLGKVVHFSETLSPTWPGLKAEKIQLPGENTITRTPL